MNQTGGKTKIKDVTKHKPCEVCGGDHKCGRGEDGALFCGRKTGDVPGFICLGPCKDSTWTIYRREDDPEILDRDRDYKEQRKRERYHADDYVNGHVNGNGKAATTKNWGAEVERFRRNLTPERAAELAESLGLPEAALYSLRVGYCPKDCHGPCWTFAEEAANGQVLGIARRYSDGSKKLMAGGTHGLYPADGWDRAEDDLFLPEGPSDTIALCAMGLPGVGRPSNNGGIEQLVQLLKDVPIDRRIIVLGEWDPKPNGDFPGRDGAVKTATELAERLGRPVCWSMPPDGAKDARAWATQTKKLDVTIADAWSVAGDEFREKTQKIYKTVRPTGKAAAPAAYKFTSIDSATFFTTSYKHEWLIRGVAVKNQPGTIGGPKKALKTTTAIDLAVSLDTATPFLGRFFVPNRQRVLVISGESGEATLQETARRICAGRAVDPATLGIHWSFRLPQAANLLDRAELCRGLGDLGVQVVIIDPLYLCLLAGLDADKVQAGNLFQMGPLLLSLAHACLQVGATPLLCHHAKKNRPGREYEPLDLDDLSFAGIAEFSRQWLLVNRREPFAPDTGSSKLWLNVGGSAGHGSLWGVDVEEGLLDENFGGRRWDVRVLTQAEVYEGRASDSGRQKEEKKLRTNRDNGTKLLRALDDLDPDRQGKSFRQVRIAAGLNYDSAERALYLLVQEKIVAEYDDQVSGGNGSKKGAKIIRRVVLNDQEVGE